jgi:hypothetical protein
MPVLLTRALYPELCALEGDGEARALLPLRPGKLVNFPAWMGSDLDIMTDCDALLKEWNAREGSVG